MENWQLIIEQLEAQQHSLAPGDANILNIANIIQSIQSDALGGNYGHALLFAQDPEAKSKTLGRIMNMARIYLPPEDSGDKGAS